MKIRGKQFLPLFPFSPFSLFSPSNKPLLCFGDIRQTRDTHEHPRLSLCSRIPSSSKRTLGALLFNDDPGSTSLTCRGCLLGPQLGGSEIKSFPLCRVDSASAHFSRVLLFSNGSDGTPDCRLRQGVCRDNALVNLRQEAVLCVVLA
ncbi:hypothetical protein I7I50_06028 [Histoplasma capsulatum G186AR]|uniref:Uncharacterized protein n=1 Tax=Ajellomyces capsulatus TaxID=5037 RepID=A0A8H8D3Q6_AJECA|nr:hypothetical protein I7I52_08766 [Histoplasma capsulatum]QSS67056.1 hypothetical protein I7I50_06028 [Histoplasma capsulatum G186AR]